MGKKLGRRQGLTPCSWRGAGRIGDATARLRAEEGMRHLAALVEAKRYVLGTMRTTEGTRSMLRSNEATAPTPERSALATR